MKINSRLSSFRLKLFLIAIGAALSFGSSAEDNPCEALLREGLYRRLNISQSSAFGLNLRSYLLTDDFKKAVTDKKFGGTADFIADGVPIQLTSNFSDNNYSEFRRKVEASKEVTIAQSSALHLLYLEPSDELAKQYVACLSQITTRIGFHLETPLVADESVIFHISYTPISPKDPPAIVTGPARLINGTIVDDANVKVGSAINTSVSIVGRRDPSREVVLVLPTDHGTVIQSVVAQAKKEVSMDMPVGTVIASFLSWQQFQIATKCNAMNPSDVWRSQTSKWCPGDGREVPGSLYSEIASQSRVPELRAMFLRGLNEFDPNPPNSVTNLDASKMDSYPLKRHAGEYEPDEVGPHTHPVKQWDGGDGNRSGRQDALYKGVQSNTGHNDGTETRPKNVAVYYYIRIN